MITKLKSLSKQKSFRKYFKNTSWLFGEKILRMLVGLFVGIWIARYLGPEQFGLFSYAQSFVGLFTVLATLGLDGVVIRELVKDESKRDILLGTAFRLKLFGALAVLVFLAIAVNFTSNNQYTNILIFIIASSTIFQSFNVIDFYFQSKVLSRYAVFANIATLLISSIVKITLILNEAPLICFAWVVVFDSFVLASGYIYFYFQNHLSFKSWYYRNSMVKHLLKESWPLIFSGLAIMIYMRIDQIMIKEMLNEKEVGLYSAGISIIEALYFIPMILTASVFPAIINLKKQNQKKYENNFQNLMIFMVWSAVILILPIYLFADEIILFLFGKDFYLAYTVTEIYCWVFVFIALGVTSSKWLLAENLQKYTMYRTFIGLIINIILNYIFIPKYGIVGAAYASLISQIFSSYLGYLSNKKTWKIFMIQTNGIIPLKLLKKLMSNE